MQGFEQVALSPRHFKNEILNYADFGLCFWRELFQNSVDAGADWIDVSIREVDEKHTIVRFRDNGPGMDEGILRNVYFRLGETTKHDTTTTGGYGKARIVTCMAQHSFKITTQDNRVEGVGGYFKIEKGEKVSGCEFEIDVDVEGRYNSHINLKEKLFWYLSRCQFPSALTVRVDGERFTQFKYKGRKVRDLSMGTVHVNKSEGGEGKILIRSSGALMYCRHNPTRYGIVVELTPEKSREILTSNRDDMTEPYKDQLDDFLNELATETQSALREKVVNKSYYFHGSGGVFRSYRRRKAPKAPSGLSGASVGVGTTSGSSGGSEVSNGLSSASPSGRVLNAGEIVTPLGGSGSGGSSGYVADPDLLNIFDIAVIDESTSPAVKRVIDRYNPKNWEFMSTGTGSGRVMYSFISMWKVAMEWAVNEYLEHTQQDSLNWAVGFLFPEDPRDLGCHQEKQGVHVFGIVPVDALGKFQWRINSRKDMAKLIACAAHEVAHIDHSWHNQDHSYHTFNYTAKLFARDREIYRAMRELKSPRVRV